MFMSSRHPPRLTHPHLSTPLNLLVLNFRADPAASTPADSFTRLTPLSHSHHSQRLCENSHSTHPQRPRLQ
jgi:hypothetical protein